MCCLCTCHKPTMSIFKTKKWWSDEVLKSGEVGEGVQNGGCIKVEKFSCHSDSDCLIVGEESVLKVYKPIKDQNASNTLLESNLNDVILQVDTGKFIPGIDDRQILVLHPQSYSIYQVHRKEGHTEAGEQNILQQISKHSFTRRAHSLASGPFGNMKTRDLICIQSLDGSLSFFDQETFLFIYVFEDVIIPGPVGYVASSDVFVICKSTWVLEIYSYQQLREFGELASSRQTKKNIPQWVYNAGEEISALQVIQTSKSFSSIVALGERHLFCFQDNGLMKYMIKFEFMPICFCAYLIGWYYEPTSRLLIMVASEDSKLFIYERTTLLWSCELEHTPISISRCFLKYLPGGIVTLSNKGIVTVSYLGTEPDLNANALPMMNDNMDPEQIQQELEAVEENLRKMLNGEEDAESQFRNIEDLLNIKADVGKPVQNLYDQFGDENEENLHLLMCPVVIILSCTDPSLIQSVRITYNCTSPFACSESTICLENVNGSEIIETQVFLSNDTDVSNAKVKVMFTITDSNGKISILTREVLLPMSLYCSPTEYVNENDVKLIIETNRPCISLTEIFIDYTAEELIRNEDSDKVSFAYRSTKRTVTIKSNDKQYSIETNDAADINVILNHMAFKLKQYHNRKNIKDYKLSVTFDDHFTKTVVHRFLKSVEAHAKERVKCKAYEDELETLQRQFTLIQKKLLVQYGALPPGDTGPLEFLMKDTHKRLINTAHDIIHSRESACRAGNTLAAVGQLLIFIFKTNIKDGFTVTLIEEMLALDSLYEDNQEWEESVIQGLSYMMNKVFQKTEKDKEKLAPVTEQGILSNINLKRFIKQLRLVLDKMFFEAKPDNSNEGNRVTRIEEFVEVI